jgi:ATP-binding cassette subfamily B protein
MYLLGYLRPYRKFLAQLALATLTGTLLSLVFPFLTQAIVDYGIGNSDLAFYCHGTCGPNGAYPGTGR